MGKGKASTASEDPLFASYVQLARSLVPDITEVGLFDGQLKCRGGTEGVKDGAIARRLEQFAWHNSDSQRSAAAAALERGTWLIAIPLEHEDGELLGAFCVTQACANAPTQPSAFADRIKRSLKPLLDCVHRELVAQRPVKSRVQTLTERTAELEWLFKITSNLKSSVDDRRVIEELLNAATQRMDSSFGILWVPSKRLCIESVYDSSQANLLLSRPVNSA